MKLRDSSCAKMLAMAKMITIFGIRALLLYLSRFVLDVWLAGTSDTSTNIFLSDSSSMYTIWHKKVNGSGFHAHDIIFRMHVQGCYVERCCLCYTMQEDV